MHIRTYSYWYLVYRYQCHPPRCHVVVSLEHPGTYLPIYPLRGAIAILLTRTYFLSMYVLVLVLVYVLCCACADGS